MEFIKQCWVFITPQLFQELGCHFLLRSQELRRVTGCELIANIRHCLTITQTSVKRNFAAAILRIDLRYAESLSFTLNDVQ